MKIDTFGVFQLGFMKLVIEFLMELLRDDVLRRQDVLMKGSNFIKEVDNAISTLRKS